MKKLFLLCGLLVIAAGAAPVGAWVISDCPVCKSRLHVHRDGVFRAILFPGEANETVLERRTVRGRARWMVVESPEVTRVERTELR